MNDETSQQSDCPPCKNILHQWFQLSAEKQDEETNLKNQRTGGSVLFTQRGSNRLTIYTEGVDQQQIYESAQFSFFINDKHRETTVDIFVDEPFDFEREYSVALQGELVPGLIVRFVSLPTLIALKEEANRPRDLDELQHLRWILEEQKDE